MPDAIRDAYGDVPFELPGLHGEGSVTVMVPALRFADAMRFLALVERLGEGDHGAAVLIVRELPRAVGLPALAPDDALRLFDRLFNVEQYAPPEEPTDEPKKPSDIRYTWADLLADYAATYGEPHPSTPWPAFLANLYRMTRFDSRERLRLFDSVSEGIGAAMGGGPEAALRRDELFRAAFPVTRTGPALAFTAPRPEAS